MEPIPFSYLVPGTVCGDPLFFLAGKEEDFRDYLQELRPTLVRYPSEDPLLDMLAEQIPRLHTAFPDSVETALVESSRTWPQGGMPVWMARGMRIPSTLLFNPRFDACVAWSLLR